MRRRRRRWQRRRPAPRAAGELQPAATPPCRTRRGGRRLPRCAPPWILCRRGRRLPRLASPQILRWSSAGPGWTAPTEKGRGRRAGEERVARRRRKGGAPWVGTWPRVAVLVRSRAPPERRGQPDLTAPPPPPRGRPATAELGSSAAAAGVPSTAVRELRPCTHAVTGPLDLRRRGARAAGASSIRSWWSSTTHGSWGARSWRRASRGERWPETEGRRS